MSKSKIAHKSLIFGKEDDMNNEIYSYVCLIPTIDKLVLQYELLRNIQWTSGLYITYDFLYEFINI